MSKCETVVTYWTPGGREVEALCGTRGGYEIVYCDECEERLHKEFPQGWRHYPGDTCPHGKYVGGCGADLMCGPCEDGE